MARIILSGLLDSLTGKLGGTVFQISNGTLIARSRVSPRNPSSDRQQNRRSVYSELVRSWSLLSPTERSSWTDAGVGYFPGIQGFVGTNSLINLTGEPRLDTFSATNKQAIFAPLTCTITTSSFDIVPIGAGSPFPASYYLLLFTSPGLPAGTASVTENNCRFIYAFPPGTAPFQSFDLWTEFLAVWPPPLSGQKVFLQFQIIRVDSGTSGIRTQATRTVS